MRECWVGHAARQEERAALYRSTLAEIGQPVLVIFRETGDQHREGMALDNLEIVRAAQQSGGAGSV